MLPLSSESLRLALCVLGAINEYRDPDSVCVQRLLSDFPELRGLPVDEVAREVIYHRLKGDSAANSLNSSTTEPAMLNHGR